MKWLNITLLALLSIPMLGNGLGPAVRAAAAPLPAGRPELHRSGPQPFVTILCKFQDARFEPALRAAVENLLAGEAVLDDYWREVSYGAINLHGSRVVGWYALPHPRSAYLAPTAAGVDLQRLAGECAAAADPDVVFGDYAGINFVFSNNLTGVPWGGNVTLTLEGSTRRFAATWLWPETLAQQSTLAHEMGHALGLDHSSAGRGREYENIWDVMSGSGACSTGEVQGSPAQHMIAYDKDLLGWIPPERKFAALPDAVSEIVLERLAQPGPGGYLMAVIPIAGSGAHFYTVEARRRAGRDGHLPGDAVVIHEVDTEMIPPARLVNHAGDGDTRVSASMWTPGMVFVDAEHDVAVSVERATPTGFAIAITTGPHPWPRSPGEGSVVPAGDVRLTWQETPGAWGYQASVHCVAPSEDAWRMPAAVVRRAGLTVALPPGDCAWRVRALPAGSWTPLSRVRVVAEVRHWLPAEHIRTPGPEEPADLAIAAGPSGEVTVAWAEPPGRSEPAAVHVARRAGGAWRSAGPFGVGQEAYIGTSPRLSWGSGSQVCATWEDIPRSGPGASPRGAGRSADLLYACWPTEAAGPDRVAGETPPGEGPPTLMHINKANLSAFPFSPDVVADGAGGSYAIWEEFGPDARADIYFAQRAAGGPWTPQVKINNGADRAPRWSPAIAVDPQGNAIALWRDGRNDSVDIYSAYRPSGGVWQPEIRLTRAGTGNPESPVIAVDGHGNAVAAWRSFCDCGGDGAIGSLLFSMRPAGGEWQTPITVAWDIGSRRRSAPAIAAAPAGGITLVWEEENDRTYILYSAYRAPDGAWTPKIAVSDSAGNAAPGRPVLAAAADGNVYLAWIDHRNGEAGLRFSGLVPDL